MYRIIKELNMGKVKSHFMSAEQHLFEIADIETLIGESESFLEFAGKVAAVDGYADWAENKSLGFERYHLSYLWDEYWSNYQ